MWRDRALVACNKEGGYADKVLGGGGVVWVVGWWGGGITCWSLAQSFVAALDLSTGLFAISS